MNPITIRRMTARDADKVAELSKQWGHACSAKDVGHRLDHALAQGGHALFVAEDSIGQLAGWIHIYAAYSLELEPHAEISGLLVNSSFRRQGVGRLLVAEADHWARDQGFNRLRVRSNVLRDEAHRFYPALGFALLKTQHNYERPVGELNG
jgi:GNAT superfamily N-acetyltransferase